MIKADPSYKKHNKDHLVESFARVGLFSRTYFTIQQEEFRAICFIAFEKSARSRLFFVRAPYVGGNSSVYLDILIIVGSK